MRKNMETINNFLFENNNKKKFIFFIKIKKKYLFQKKKKMLKFSKYHSLRDEEDESNETVHSNKNPIRYIISPGYRGLSIIFISLISFLMFTCCTMAFSLNIKHGCEEKICHFENKATVNGTEIKNSCLMWTFEKNIIQEQCIIQNECPYFKSVPCYLLKNNIDCYTFICYNMEFLIAAVVSFVFFITSIVLVMYSMWKFCYQIEENNGANVKLVFDN